MSEAIREITDEQMAQINEIKSRLDQFNATIAQYDDDDLSAFTEEQIMDIRRKLGPYHIKSPGAQDYKFAMKDRANLKDPTIKHNNVSPYASPHSVYEWPEYNFSDVTIIEETEPLVARAHNRKEGLALKEGWSIKGKNPKTVNYVKKRLAEICRNSKTSVPEFMREILVNLIKYSNYWCIFVRDAMKSSGRVVDGLNPIAGIFTVPTETVKLKFDKKGNTTHIAQEVYGRSARKTKWSNKYFAHFKINDKAGFSVGTPLLVPVKDDIAALRRIEEDIEILLYQHLFPLYIYTVGTEKQPARIFPDGSTEVHATQKKWARMPSEGAIVVPERHKIDVLSAKQAVMDATNYLKYFKQRVLAGIAISGLDIGEGDTANRSTSDNLSKVLIDDVKYTQKRAAWQFNRMIIEPILLESPFPQDKVLSPENNVYIEFAEIDMDTLIKVQNHHAQLFSQHAITHSELRQAIQKEELTDKEWEDTYFKLIQEPLELLKNKQGGHTAEAEALARHKRSAITPKGIKGEIKYAENIQKQSAQQAKAAGAKPTSGQRAGASINRPSNQYGQKSGPEARKSNWVLDQFRSSKDCMAYIDTYKNTIKSQMINNSLDLIEKANIGIGSYNKTVRSYVDSVLEFSIDHLKERLKTLSVCNANNFTNHYLDEVNASISKYMLVLNQNKGNYKIYKNNQEWNAPEILDAIISSEIELRDEHGQNILFA